MSQAILISNNEVINNLYEVNLRAYVATNVTIKSSLEEAIELIKLSPNIDAIICFWELNQQDNAVEKFNNIIAENKLSIPIIILGNPGRTVTHSLVIKNKYDIKSLLQAMAKVLEISAKDMVQKEVPKFFPIPIKLIAELKSSFCDIYYRTEKENFEFEYFKIIEKESDLGNSLKKYAETGVEHLYIDSNQRLKFINKTSSLITKELERKDLSKAEKVEITAQGMTFVAGDIFENNEVSQAVADISLACVAAISEVIKDVPKVKNLLSMLLENKSNFVYKHSVLATYFAIEIIKNISWGSREQQEKVAFALFFHDIYLLPIYQKYEGVSSEEDLMFREDLSDDDKEILLDHASMAGQLLKTFPRCPLGADTIVTQHHGMTTGQGFAINFKDDISPLAKIIIIAEDIATGILLKIANGDKKSALDKTMIMDGLLQRYRSHNYRKIIESLQQIEI